MEEPTTEEPSPVEKSVRSEVTVTFTIAVADIVVVEVEGGGILDNPVVIELLHATSTKDAMWSALEPTVDVDSPRAICPP